LQVSLQAFPWKLQVSLWSSQWHLNWRLEDDDGLTLASPYANTAACTFTPSVVQLGGFKCRPHYTLPTVRYTILNSEKTQ
jgi:hypothetical protein